MLNKPDKEYLHSLSNRDQAWAHIREHRGYLESVMIDRKNLSIKDLTVFFHCLLLTITEIKMFSPDLSDLSDLSEEVKSLIQDTSAAGLLKRVQFESKAIKIIEDYNSTVDQKSESILMLRRSIWGAIACDMDSIVSLMVKYPYITDAKDIMLMYRCVDAVLCTLEIEDKNIEMIY